MDTSPVRRPFRAFLLTPFVYAFLVIAFVYTPFFLVEGRENDGGEALIYYFAFMYFLFTVIGAYLALILALPIYIWMRKAKTEKALIPVLFGTIISGLFFSTILGGLYFPILVGSVTGGLSGLFFWRLYSGRWWGRINEPAI